MREREGDGGREKEMEGENDRKEGEWVVELQSSCKREWQCTWSCSQNLMLSDVLLIVIPGTHLVNVAGCPSTLT